MTPRWLILLLVPLIACVSRNETAYGSCAASSACAESTPRCLTVSNTVTLRQIGLCTTACTVDSDCPDQGTCSITTGGALGGFCVQRCADPSECRFAAAICPNVHPASLPPQGGCVP